MFSAIQPRSHTKGIYTSPTLILNCHAAFEFSQIKHVEELSPHLQCKPYVQNSSLNHDHTYTKLNLMHPLTLTTDCYIVGDRFHDRIKTSGHKKETCKFHQMDLCPELREYESVTSEVINCKIKSVRLQSSNQQNMAHYFIYNRLQDYWHNRNLVDYALP